MKLLILTISIPKSKSKLNATQFFLSTAIKTYQIIKNFILAIHVILKLQILKNTDLVMHTILSRTSMHNNMKLQIKIPFKTLLCPSYVVFINASILSYFHKSQKLIENKHFWLTRALSITSLSMGQSNFVALKEKQNNFLKILKDKNFLPGHHQDFLTRQKRWWTLEKLNKIISITRSTNPTKNGNPTTKKCHCWRGKINLIQEIELRSLIIPSKSKKCFQTSRWYAI